MEEGPENDVEGGGLEDDEHSRSRPSKRAESGFDQSMDFEGEELHGDQYVQEVTNMQDMQRTFSSVIKDFESDDTMGVILSEYRKMYQALMDSHTKQRRYMLMVSSLQCDIKNNEEKVSMALHLSQEDKEIIKNLTRQANQAWYEAEMMTVKENRARNVIVKLQDSIGHMMHMVEEGSGLAQIQQVAQTAVGERKELEEVLVTMKEEVEFKEVKIQELNERMNQKEEALLKDIYAMKDRVVSVEKKRTEIQKKLSDQEEYVQMLERWRTNLTGENNAHVAEIENLKVKIGRFESNETEMKAELLRSQNMYNEQQDINTEKHREIVKLNSEIENQKKRVKTLHSSLAQLKEKFDERETEARIMERILQKRNAEVEMLNKRIENTSTSMKGVQADLLQRELEMKDQREKMATMVLNINACYKKAMHLKEEADRTKRTADLVDQKNIKMTTKNTGLEEKINLREKNFIALFKEMNDVAIQLKKSLERISSLEYEKERLYGVINKILEAINRMAIDNDNKESKLMTLLKVHGEQEQCLSTVNTKLFRMTNQRDNIANELHMIQLRNDELNLANINYNKQITSLAEDLQLKEMELDKSLNSNNILRNEIHSLQSDMVNWQEEVKKKQQKIVELEQMIRAVDKVLCKKEMQLGQLRLTIDQVVTQRNLLGYQCIIKKEQIQFLTEKTKLMNNMFNMGNLAYNQQTHLISDLRKKIGQLYHQKNYVMNRLENVSNYKSKLGLANTHLVKALARNLAIEGEHPNNLHRWKHLKAADISQYEMVLKTQFLLKRVIGKTEEVTRLEGVVFEKNALITELKFKLENRPGPELVLKATITEKEKEKLSRKLKATIAERNMCSSQNDLYKVQNKCLLSELMEEKKRTNVCKKQQIVVKTKLSKLPKIQNPCSFLPKLL